MNFLKTLVAASVAGAMLVGAVSAQEDSLRPREYGIQFGVLQTGQNNAITDVPGVLVGQVNVHDDKKGAHTGVTAILPHGGNLFKEKVPDRKSVVEGKSVRSGGDGGGGRGV